MTILSFFLQIKGIIILGIYVGNDPWKIKIYIFNKMVLFCSLYPHLFSRAYINFKNPEDIVLFRDRFDGYVFIDNKGKTLHTSVQKHHRKQKLIKII